MNCEDVKINLPEYIDGKLNERTTEAIREHLQSCVLCTELHDELNSFWGYLETFPSPEIPEGMKDEFMELVKSQEKTTQRKIRTIPFWLKVAAMIVIVSGTYWLGFQVGSGKSELKNNLLVNELSQQKQKLILASLSDFTGPQKIEAVYSISSSGHVNDALINALVNTMNSDKNINVRLAAISALSGMMDKNERIKTDLIKSLAIQENPLLQISLIQVLTESGVKEARDEIESITNNEKTDESVKAFAKNMIKTII